MLPCYLIRFCIQFIRQDTKVSYLSCSFDFTLSHLIIQLFSDQIFLRTELNTLCNLLFPVGFYCNKFGSNQEEISCTLPSIFLKYLLSTYCVAGSVLEAGDLVNNSLSLLSPFIPENLKNKKQTVSWPSTSG